MKKTRKKCLHFLLTPWESAPSQQVFLKDCLGNYALETKCSAYKENKIPELLFCLGFKGTGMHKSPSPIRLKWGRNEVP